MRIDRLFALALALAFAAPAFGDEDGDEPAPVKPSAYKPLTSARETFACDIPSKGWTVIEEEAPSGSATHALGPAEEDGRWRAALHVHFMDKNQPGCVPMEDAVKRERRSDPTSARTAGAVRRFWVARRSARVFEVEETRLLPPDRLPATPSVLHHYYAFVPAGDGYFIIKLSTARETFVDYRGTFEQVLRTFRVLGAS
ncbi:MAG: hypothetical protein NTX64_13705 [Elusimicrobia bacterium]|nr:hypothetical protein [Elusimicrobiota bacterium]